VARIVLNTFGSFGDIHPYLAIAIELQRRGHIAVIATSEVYRAKIKAEGVQFAAIRPDVGELMGNTAFLAKLWHPKLGSMYLLRDYLLPAVKEGYEDLSAACSGADFLLTHAAGYAGPLVAEKLKLRWLSIALQPAILFSIMDPPVLAAATWLRYFYALGNWPFGLLMHGARWQTRRWAKPVLELRRQLGLHTEVNPVIEGQFSPFGTLALFSPQFAAPQLDWPVNIQTTGFLFYDRRGEGFGLPPEHPSGLSEGLKKFLDSGPAPLLFTLGSSAVMQPGSFYTESAMAAKALGMRAVMLVGKGENVAVQPDDSLHVEEYASYAALMPRCAAIVHQGGIGTVAQALRSGRPMLVVPWAHDQPDNAERLRGLGVARVQNRGSYTAAAATKHLRELTRNETYSHKAAALAKSISQEDGLTVTCNAIEAALS
jgi:UDP:flavonoid glycosyltransferase YjiC (YdhE family)